jgi:4,5:9,10-diseco-3-hydroxy-5,9,17-trioxoandrosta-1(10),2-diene-4-oate hydrolase
MDIDEIIGEIEEIRKRGYGEYVTVGGIKIRYLVMGSGPQVLLLHGFGGFLETWAFNLPSLSKHYQVYAIDLPGHGLSDKPESCYTTAFAIESANDIMEALGVNQAALIGHSLGGAVSINIAMSLPERVSKLVLIDCAGLSRNLPWLYRLSSLPVLGNILMSLAVEPALERSIKRLFYSSPVLSQEMIDIILKNASQPRVRETLIRIIRQNVSLRGPRPEALLIKRLPQLKVPTLFIHGAQDRVLPLEHVRDAFSMAPNSKVKIFDQCGHCPHIEKAVEFNEIVLEFLAGN